MYVPSYFQEHDVKRIAAIIEAMPLAQLISNDESGALCLNPIPLYIEATQPSFIFLGHMSKANRQWKHFKKQPVVHGSFQGTSAYISPLWYQDDVSQQVPTWNYTFIEFKGRVELIEDTQGLISLLTTMSDAFEKRNGTNWEFGIPDDLQRDMLSRSIVGMRIYVEHIDAKFKLNQNRTEEERKNVVKELDHSKWPQQSVAAIMKSMF